MNPDAYHAFMIDYASGNLTGELALAAQLHTVLSRRGQAADQIWAAVACEIGQIEAFSASDHNLLPEALELSRTRLDTIPWKRGLSGVQYAKRGRAKGQLMRLDPGQCAPEHSHSACEATVVLKGRFTDGPHVYDRGDLIVAGPGDRHRPAAYGSEMCVCYVGKAPRPFWRLS